MTELPTAITEVDEDVKTEELAYTETVFRCRNCDSTTHTTADCPQMQHIPDPERKSLAVFLGATEARASYNQSVFWLATPLVLDWMAGQRHSFWIKETKASEDDIREFNLKELQRRFNTVCMSGHLRREGWTPVIDAVVTQEPQTEISMIEMQVDYNMQIDSNSDSDLTDDEMPPLSNVAGLDREEAEDLHTCHG